MQIYLPIAEMPVNMFLIFGLGVAVGIVSGMFGVGGGFLLTPLLIFIGIPPAISIASVSAQLAASSFSGAISYWRRDAIDLSLGFVLLVGGMIGTAAGVSLFALLRRFGQLDLVIGLSYLGFLGTIGMLMVIESTRTILRTRRGVKTTLRKAGEHGWLHGLPWKIRFRRSGLYISAIPVAALGAGIAFIGAILGIGGGFLLVPALIYLLKVPTNVVLGTSLFQTLVTMLAAVMMHAVANQSVDMVLAFILMVGGTIGAQFGARAGMAIKGEQLRFLLGVLVIFVGIRFAYTLVAAPPDLYSTTTVEVPK